MKTRIRKKPKPQPVPFIEAFEYRAFIHWLEARRFRTMRATTEHLEVVDIMLSDGLRHVSLRLKPDGTYRSSHVGTNLIRAFKGLPRNQ